MRNFLFVLFFFFLSVNSFCQNLNEFYEKSLKAYNNKNYKEFNNYTYEALKIHPSQPTLLYNLAVSYSLMGDINTAYLTIKKILSWNAALKYEKDKKLLNLLNNRELSDSLKDAKRFYLKQKKNSKIFLKISNNTHIEDFLIIGDFILFTDLHNGVIVKYNFKKKYLDAKVYFKSAPLALTKDKDSTFIWASSSMIRNNKEFKVSKLNESSIYKIQVSDMRIVNEIKLPDKAIIGSMIIYQDRLYATNSLNPEVIIINTKTNSIEKIQKIEDAFNLQGITLDRKNQILFIADYIKGILKINLKNSNRTWLKSSNDYLLKGIDGLALVKENTFYAVQNNSTPKKLIKIIYDTNYIISKVEIIDNAISNGGEPTNIKLTTQGLLYLSNSQWPFYDENFNALYDNWIDQEIRLISYLSEND